MGDMVHESVRMTGKRTRRAAAGKWLGGLAP
jgi:hypothetical protein